MSTTSKKTSILDDLKAQAAALAAKIKEETNKHLEGLHLKLKDAHESVEKLTAEIRSHTGEPAPAKRGRKKGSTNKAQSVETSKTNRKKGKVKRGKLNEKILAFLATKGKTGAHIKEIADAVGSKPNNVTAWTQTTGKSKIKKTAPATFALK